MENFLNSHGTRRALHVGSGSRRPQDYREVVEFNSTVYRTLFVLDLMQDTNEENGLLMDKYKVCDGKDLVGVKHKGLDLFVGSFTSKHHTSVSQRRKHKVVVVVVHDDDDDDDDDNEEEEDDDDRVSKNKR